MASELLILRANSTNPIFEVDLRFPVSLFLAFRHVHTGVVDVDAIGNLVLDVNGLDVGSQLVIDYVDDRVEAVVLARPEIVDTREFVFGREPDTRTISETCVKSRICLPSR